MFGPAIGRIGCFFAGCCAGRPTGSRFGIWSASRPELGVRRIPTQLMESASALAVGLAALAVVIVRGTEDGAVFVAVISAYTLARQGILRQREEARDSKLGLALTAATAAVVLTVAGTLIAVTL